jgi:RHS repeat-associated protein
LDRDFAQLTQSYQAHGGEVNTGTTPQVQYSYADGTSNTIRITGMTYPNGRNVVDDYGTTGSMNDAASRIFGMKDSGASSNLVEYSYLGLSGFVKTVYPESSAQYTLIGTTGGTNPDSGDIYLGLDRFGRVIDANWANVAGTVTLARVKYGYNRVSSRTWRDNLSPGMTGYDELYGYDQLQRLQTLGRGTLNGTQTAITSPTFGQDWTLDETGNWNGFKQSDNGTTWPLDQSRTANTVNEITSLVNETSKAWTTPGYDKAGNMTRIPVPGTLPDGVAWNTMSLSEWDNLKLDDWEEMTLDNVEGVYDAWNRLVRLHVGDTTLAEYAYDARGYRIRKDRYTDGTLSEERHYYYTPGWQVVEERVDTSTSADRQFVWGLRYIDDLVLRDRDSDGNGPLDERRYCLQDGNWNTIALTSTSGSVTERFSYDAYGVPTFPTDTGTVQASSATGWEILYAGYRWDGDPSRMYYVRNRFLLPYLGEWNRRDPLGYHDGTNVYGLYQSINAVDPLGLGFWSVVGNFAAGAVVGAVAGFVIGATVAVLSPVAAAIVVGAVVVSTVVHVGALGVRAYHGDVSAEEVAFTAGAFATGGRGFRSGREFGKVVSEPILPGSAFDLPGFGSSPSGGTGTGGSGAQTSAPRCRHHGSPESIKSIENDMAINQARPNDVYVETPPFGATTGPAGPKQALNAAAEGAFVEFDLPQGAYPDIGVPGRSMAIPLNGQKSLPLENLNPEFHKFSLWERCVNSFKKRQ